ncbi:SGNH/GDSL hydrolase family protein [Streptomyces sp. TRM 70351]|uniref:SGNH/GDSL hydrolase family protein n=1 Tax=Streptomyces sp. TRM 70351 TaxID=3116552 RepID=UPI002E7BBAA1|nr:SGNH/GDSL hydrolase family protein [Streptomyces sp. TRM 70351]MEE1930212.1 SGNH/GDSL hydrolase family protein [Streptomyces sp. TRM 70351]
MSERHARTPRLRGAAVAALSAVLAATGLTASPAAAAEPETGRYVALGDSFTSGPGIPGQDPDSGICGRSERNYPALVAERLGVTSFTDVSCGGAVTDHMTTSQFGVEPQFRALSADTELVTVGIGGNDIGFAGIVLTCAFLAVFDRDGTPCTDHYTRGGTDTLEQRYAEAEPKVAAVLRGVKERAPGARVLLVGYPVLTPASAQECAPGNPNADVYAHGDAPYLHATQRSFNERLRKVAEANGAAFVDTFARSAGHDACQAEGVRWVEGVLDVRDAFPVHPNALGMRASADAVLDTLDR